MVARFALVVTNSLSPLRLKLNPPFVNNYEVRKVQEIFGQRVVNWLNKEEVEKNGQGNIYAYVVWCIGILEESKMSKESISSWMLGMNPDLDDECPIEVLIRAGANDAENGRMADQVINSARAFVS